MTPRGFRRLIRWLKSRRLTRDIDDEMTFHLEMETARGVAGGLDADTARTRALQTFGSTVRIREESRDAHGLRWWDELVGDVRQVARSARRSPSFFLMLVGTLGIGLFLAVTIMAAVDAILLRPVPYVDGERTVELRSSRETAEGRRVRSTLTMNEWHYWSERKNLFDAISAYDLRGFEYSGTDDATVISGATVSADFFRVFRVPPVIGRVLRPGDFEPGALPVAVVSHRFWRTRLGGDSAAIGNLVRLDGRPTTVIGVLQPDFKFPRRATEVWIPMPPQNSDLFLVWVQARLRTDAASTQRVIAVQPEAGEGDLGHAVELRPFEGRRVNAEVRRGLYLMLGAAVAILAISGLNVMNLLLFRGLERGCEYGMRLALGAGRRRILRQVVVETLAVGVLAATLALLLGQGSIGLLAKLLPPEYTVFAFHDVVLTRRIFVATAAGTVLLALLIGVLPAVSASNADATVFRLVTSGRSRGSMRQRGVWSGLVVLQLAFTALLLVGGGLLVRSFVAVNRVDLGLEAGRLTLVDLQLSTDRYQDAAARNDFTLRLERRIWQLPGVEAISYSDGMPPNTGMRFGSHVMTEDDRDAQGRDPGMIAQLAVDTNYFRTVGTPIIRGRGFRAADVGSTEHPIVIDADFARWLWPEGDPIGRRVRFDDEEWSTVVGVAADTKATGADDRAFHFVLFLPTRMADLRSVRSIAIRTSGDPRLLIRPLHEAIRELDPLQPIWRIQTAENAFSATLAKPRFLSWLMGSFAGTGLFLGLAGLYGVLAFGVSQQKREIGIRMALGAAPGTVVKEVTRRSIRLALLGSGIGLAVALRAAMAARPLLFETSAHDPLVLVGVPLILGVIAVIASVVPALQASRVDPVEVLRVE